MSPKVSRVAWIGLGGSAALCVAVIAASRQFRPARLAGDPILASLLAEQVSLRGNDDVTRDALRRQWQEMQSHAWDAATLRKLRTELNDAWSCEVMTSPTEPALTPIVFKRTAVSLEDWPAIRATVELIERKPGVVMTALEIIADGAGSQRRFQRVSLTLGVVWRDTTAVNTERAPASPTPRFAAPVEPAGARDIGARPAGADDPRDHAGRPLL